MKVRKKNSVILTYLKFHFTQDICSRCIFECSVLVASDQWSMMHLSHHFCTELYQWVQSAQQLAGWLRKRVNRCCSRSLRDRPMFTTPGIHKKAVFTPPGVNKKLMASTRIFTVLTQAKIPNCWRKRPVWWVTSTQLSVEAESTSDCSITSKL